MYSSFFLNSHHPEPSSFQGYSFLASFLSFFSGINNITWDRRWNKKKGRLAASHSTEALDSTSFASRDSTFRTSKGKLEGVSAFQGDKSPSFA
jgi:hypothetical protein